MDFLLNPNFAYLMLVIGVLLGMMAIVTPGTGLLELGAVFCLLLAGYGAFNLDINPWAPVVLIIAVVPFIYALRGTRRLLMLGLSILGFIVGSVFLFVNPNGWPAVNPILATVVSLLAGGFLWITVSKTMQAFQTRPSHDLDALLGQIGEAKTRVHEQGSVQVAGELWTARSDKVIPAGSAVRVTGREGFVLVVEKTQVS